MQKVLVLEDDADLRAEIVDALEDEAFSARGCGTVRAFWADYARFDPDIAVVDLTLPDGRGTDVIRELRAKSLIGILVLSGRREEADRIIALEFGADDFVQKPCSPRELVARLNAILRRTSPGSERGEERQRIAEFAGYKLDCWTMEVAGPGGEVMALTTAEFDLLRVFLDRAQRVLSRGELLDLLRGEDWAGYDRTVDGLVSRLRRKMPGTDDMPQLFKTVHGTGYMLACPVVFS
ncbi:MAG: response regulator transcription factor [Pseudomonadota bacterium]